MKKEAFQGCVKRLAILGSTGSIGQQTLEVVRSLPSRFQVVGLAAGRNTTLLAKQIGEFQPKLVSALLDEGQSSSAQDMLPPESHFLSLEEIASHPDVDLVVIATAGKAGLAPTLSALRAGKSVALANKEVLVMAGEIVTAAAREYGGQILPVDSEHSALWQCLHGEANKVDRLLLTASGGPFYHYSPAELAAVTVEAALNHPTWRMGKKVTIDSATLMNKGMETIEARWLFNIPLENIEVIIHPQSIVHSMVEFVDGSIKAQLGFPDMRLPIQYALAFPERFPNPDLPRLDLTKKLTLTFEPPDQNRFPCLGLAAEAGEKGGTYPAVMCAADEVAVELFLSRRIGFLDIARIVEKALEQHQNIAHPTQEEILAADNWARDIITLDWRRG